MQNSLESFFKDVSKTALLTREQEVELSQRIEKGDTRARDHMVRANVRLAISIAKKYQDKGCDLEDLIQESNIGLMKAVDRFDWRRGFKFSTYACWWIKQAVRRHVTSQSTSVKLPSYTRNLLWKIKQAKEEYYKEFGSHPSQEEIADLVGITLKMLKNISTCATSPVSLDKPINYKNSGDSGNRTLREIIPDVDTPNVEDVLDGEKVSHLLKQALKSLSHREEQVIRLRFGVSTPQTRSDFEVNERDFLKLNQKTKEMVR